jgi:hypothetical protein
MQTKNKTAGIAGFFYAFLLVKSVVDGLDQKKIAGV